MININEVTNFDLDPADEEQMAELLAQSKTFIPQMEEPQGLIIGVYVRWENDLVMLPKPRRHPHCIWCGCREYGRWLGDGHIDQGFFTENFVLLDRYEAREYAYKIKQIDKATYGYRDIIFSEDLW